MSTDSTNTTPEQGPKRLSTGALIRWAITGAALVHIVIFVVLFVMSQDPGGSVADGSLDSSGSNTGGSSEKGANAGDRDQPPGPIDNSPQWQQPVEQLVADAVANHSELDDEQKQSELADNVNRLEQISNQQNVDQITETLKPLLKVADRATEPSDEPVEGDFDFNSAQIHDVERIEADGKFQYFTVLLDKDGRTMRAEMPAGEGEKLHETFQMVKKSPLLASIYRGVMMGMLDNLLAEKKNSDEEE